MSRVSSGGLAALTMAAVAAAAMAAPVFAHDASLTPLDSLVSPRVIHLAAARSADVSGGPAVTGAFGSPFAEPTIGGTRTDAKCIDRPTPNGGLNGPTASVCKPAAGTLVQLADGRLLYWDALEGTENNKYSIVTEGGMTFTNDSARLLSLGATPSWFAPNPVDGGANPNGNPGEPLVPGLSTSESYNDGALFGSHESFLPDGRLLVQGGTDYSADPGVNGIPFGVVELTGLKQTRIFNPASSTFSQTADTAYRRWYPTVIETGQGHYLDFSGVGKLLKPVYPGHPQDSGTNVKQVEEYDPATGQWRQLPASADYDLPLYPRMHLLPDGHVFFNGAGQDFNPFGQSTGQVNWNQLASLDLRTNSWTQLGLANTATPTAPAFRGSTSSTMLPLTPDANGHYTKASFLTAGGVLGTSPGSYLPTSESSITTVDTSSGQERVSQRRTGPLGQARWFGQNILLPNGQVVVFSGADKDEVVLPGTEMPVQQAELFDPVKGTWSPLAVAHQPRTYHNSAVLRPDGSVLVGGHATISTGYLNNTTLPGGFAPHDGRDPSFEVYKPPYLFQGARPGIVTTSGLMGYGGTFDIQVEGDAREIQSVALVRNSAITHIVDADQRTVMLRILARNGHTVTVAAPPDGNVAPPGPYMLFVIRNGVPSVARQLLVSADAAAVRRALARVCVDRRHFSVPLPYRHRGRVRRATIYVNGHRVRVVRGRNLRRVSIPRLPAGRFTVRIVAITDRRARVTSVRSYAGCGQTHRRQRVHQHRARRLRRR